MPYVMVLYEVGLPQVKCYKVVGMNYVSRFIDSFKISFYFHC